MSAPVFIAVGTVSIEAPALPRGNAAPIANSSQVKERIRAGVLAEARPL